MKLDHLEFDKEHLWHPYTSLTNPLATYPVARADGVYLTFDDGSRVIDGMASWWCAIHGYNHPRLNSAIQDQLGKMAHIMFGGLTHQSAIGLGERLVALTAEPLKNVFLADSGSVSVEVAIKMAIQYWHGRGEPKRQQLLTVRGGYHGDTFGAMSVCDPVNGMHQLFNGVLTQQLFAPRPAIKPNEEWCTEEIDPFRQLLEENRDVIAAVILEPIVQGAGGMNFYHPNYLREVRALCDKHNVLLILDEIATGFGRSGKLFAYEHAGIVPDILCVGKALTGGYLSLAATLVTDEVAAGVCANGGVLMHGPTFMGNPLACSVANASIDLLMESPWQQRVEDIQQHLSDSLMPLTAFDAVADVRVMGAIGVVEMARPLDVGRVQKQLISNGVWLRPFGKLLYTMPPFITPPAELEKITDAMTAVVETIC